MESNETARPYEGRAQDGTASGATDASAKNPDIAAAPDLTRFQVDLLATIRRLQTTSVQCYGLAIKEALETTYGEEINHGRLYPNLDELIEHGLVEKRELDKRTNEYELRDAGLDLLGDRLQWLAAALEADVEGSPTNRKHAAAGGDD